MPPAKRPLRLAFIAPGNSIHTRRWLEYLVARGHDVGLISYGRFEERIEGIELLDELTAFSRVDRRTRGYLDFVIAARRVRRVVRVHDIRCEAANNAPHPSRGDDEVEVTSRATIDARERRQFVEQLDPFDALFEPAVRDQPNVMAARDEVLEPAPRMDAVDRRDERQAQRPLSRWHAPRSALLASHSPTRLRRNQPRCPSERDDMEPRAPLKLRGARRQQRRAPDRQRRRAVGRSSTGRG